MADLPTAPTTDPCGNPLPIALPATDLAFPLPTLADLLNLIGVPHIPKTEVATPCPILLDQLAAAAPTAPGGT